MLGIVFSVQTPFCYSIFANAFNLSGCLCIICLCSFWYFHPKLLLLAYYDREFIKIITSLRLLIKMLSKTNYYLLRGKLPGIPLINAKCCLFLIVTFQPTKPCSSPGLHKSVVFFFLTQSSVFKLCDTQSFKALMKSMLYCIL